MSCRSDLRSIADIARGMTAERIAEHHVGRLVRRTLSTHSSYPDAGQLPIRIDRALRLLIPLPVLIRNDQGESDGQA
jgi:hypothetical protein